MSFDHQGPDNDYNPWAAPWRSRNLYLREVAVRMREYVAIGDGVMDFKAIADTVKAVGFVGFLFLEQDKFGGDMKKVRRRYVTMMKEYLS